jgi:transposase-like protein
MVRSSSQPQVAATLLDDERAAVRPVTCPMCHAPAPQTQSAIDAGAGWRCVRCGQRWDARRLSAVAAYAAWVVERAAVGERSTWPSLHASMETVGR